MITYSKLTGYTADENMVEAYGLSTDDKPTDVANGSCFIEMDSGKVYFFDAIG